MTDAAIQGAKQQRDVEQTWLRYIGRACSGAAVQSRPFQRLETGLPWSAAGLPHAEAEMLEMSLRACMFILAQEPCLQLT